MEVKQAVVFPSDGDTEYEHYEGNMNRDRGQDEEEEEEEEEEGYSREDMEVDSEPFDSLSATRTDSES